MTTSPSSKPSRVSASTSPHQRTNPLSMCRSMALARFAPRSGVAHAALTNARGTPSSSRKPSMSDSPSWPSRSTCSMSVTGEKPSVSNHVPNRGIFRHRSPRTCPAAAGPSGHQLPLVQYTSLCLHRCPGSAQLLISYCSKPAAANRPCTQVYMSASNDSSTCKTKPLSRRRRSGVPGS